MLILTGAALIREREHEHWIVEHLLAMPGQASQTKNQMRGYHVSAKSGLIWDLIVGGATALGVGALGWLETTMARTPEAADVSIREFGTLLTVLFGAVAALWWNQSARPPNMQSDEDAPASQSQVDANILNGAAATFTVLSLFCSVFASAPWRSTGSLLSGIGVLVVLTFAGSDIRQAVPITLAQRPLLREIFVLALIVVAAAVLLWHFGA